MTQGRRVGGAALQAVTLGLMTRPRRVSVGQPAVCMCVRERQLMTSFGVMSLLTLSGWNANTQRGATQNL